MRAFERFWRRRTPEFGHSPELLAFLSISHKYEIDKIRRCSNCLVCGIFGCGSLKIVVVPLNQICDMPAFLRFRRRRAAKSAGRCTAKKSNSIKSSAPLSALVTEGSLRFAGFFALLAASNRQKRGALHCEKVKLHKTVRAPS